MPHRTSKETFLGVAALVLVLLLALARSSQEHRAQPSTPTSYDTGRYGYRALYDLLEREGIRIARFTRNHHFLDRHVGTLIVARSAYGAASDEVSRNDVLNLKDWVHRGGVLVVLAPPYGDAYDTLLGIPSSRAARVRSQAAVPFDPSPTAQGVSSIAGDFADEFALGASLKALPMLVTKSGIVAMHYRLGSGAVVAFTDYSIFSNANLDRADNARFAVQLFAGLPAPVAFDETIHGYGTQQSLWGALPGPVHVSLYLIVFALLVSIAGNLWRFAPPLAGPREIERDSSAYITSMANLLARAHASGKALRDDADSALRAVRRALGLSERTTIATVLARLHDPRQRQAVLELDRLRDLERPSDAELLRAGALSFQLRKDFG